MASSSYYSSLMLDYAEAKGVNELKKSEYEKYIKKLEEVKNDIPIVIEHLSTSESTFRNGGYYDGDTPDRGSINNSVTKLTNAANIIDSVVFKTSEKISDYSKEIDKYAKLYNEARSNYEAAKKRESAQK